MSSTEVHADGRPEWTEKQKQGPHPFPDDLFPLDQMWWLTPAELTAQFEQMNSGDRIVYGVGQLDYAREITASAKDIHAVTARLFRQGKATLTKKNLGPGKAEYWLVKR